uniref:Bromo domain-containing protein n=1 Tax=Chenopodium quinoa TaxID=63459 RepID=A0A803LY70_CHEQI
IEKRRRKKGRPSKADLAARVVSDDDDCDVGVSPSSAAAEREVRRRIPNGKIDHRDDCITPLPDKKQLELILDKLQKKDTYGVYAEPVDPEELPDYHDVVEHPMDFSTVRKKLANGSYSTLEQFESDVFLISSNAMQYNAPETVYHKQARAIKELAEKKFQRIRMQIERLEKEPKSEPKSETKLEPKSEQKERSYSQIKKQTKKLLYRGAQEPVGSDFSSGAILATMDAPNMCGVDHVSNFERPSNTDGPVEGISTLADNNIEKTEDTQSGKGVLPKFGRRSFVVDENRRATYNISNQPEDRPESIFTTFEDDKKQLIPVGLSGEFSYARSLARYAANLGPKAWTIASKRIEQALPPGHKHGRGWIGEYEPLPRAVLVVEHRKDPFASRLHNAFESKKDNKIDPFASRLHNAVDLRKDDKKVPIVSRSDAIDSIKADKLLDGRSQAHVLVKQPSSNGKSASMFGSGEAKASASKLATVVGSGEAKPPASTLLVSQQHNPFSRGFQHVNFKDAESNSPSLNSHPDSVVFRQQSHQPRDSVCPENMGAKRVEPNSPSISDQKRGHFTQKQLPHGMEIGQRRVETKFQPTSIQKTDNFPHKPAHLMEMPASMPSESLTKGKIFLQSPPFKQPDTNGDAPDVFSNGKVVNNFVGNNRIVTSSPGLMSPQLGGPPLSFPQKQSQNQGLSDPVLVMKMMTEKAQRQQNGSTNAHSPAQGRPSVPLSSGSIHAHSPAQARPSVPSPRGDTGGNAAAAAASAWMSVGSAGFRPNAQNSATNRGQVSADSSYNATRMFYPQAMQPQTEYPVSNMMHIQREKMGFPFQSSASQPIKVGNEAQAPSRPTVFPHQLVTNDLSRFQVQAPWRGLSPYTQQKQKQDTLPPDLNVAFQSSVDSQQPDLALQL